MIITNGIILNQGITFIPEPPAVFGGIIVSAKIYSTFNGGLRSANYIVQYSDDNSTWTTAFGGVMSNNSSYGEQLGTVTTGGSGTVGNGSYGSHLYWRYVEGSAVVSHHPRTSRITLISSTGVSYNLIVYVADNTSDSGEYEIGTVTGTPFPTPTVEYLVVGGGGGGGGRHGGGGGAGGYRTASGLAVSVGTYAVTVGAGGTGFLNNDLGVAANGTSGNNSVFSSITSAGGGGGGGASSGLAIAGGSGGGGQYGGSGAAGNTPSTSPSQGNSGGSASTTADAYPGGGGGGASAAGASFSGSTAGNGGAGSSSSISGTATIYSGGGGGGSYINGTPGSGGLGGGGNGSGTGTKGGNGTANLGGGGGGGGNTDAPNAGGGNGGSGIVIIRYSDAYSAASATTGSPNVIVAGGYRIYNWTSSGSITF
jgi:hypothetical protein